VPELRRMVNSGNTRRESAQAYLIPLLAEAGFNVIADNCEALPCVFQQRLPALDYDIGMYISTAPPDPAYLVNSFTCAQIPTPENNNQGQNQQGVCNEEASALLEESDVTVDEEARADLIKEALELLSEDNFTLPLLQFPKSGFYRSDRVGGPVDAELNNYRAFKNIAEWEDVDGDGQIIIGAEQYPGCLNPVTECANSSWYVWVAETPVLPGIWRTTNDSLYELTPLVAGEPVVEVLGS
jgi:ABC-type transport system substrate-binding protein